MLQKIFLITLVLGLAACESGTQIKASSLVAESLASSSCPNFKSQLYDELFSWTDEDADFKMPSSDELEAELKSKISNSQIIDVTLKTKYIDSIISIYKIFAAQPDVAANDFKKFLAHLETQDQSEYKYKSALANLDQLVNQTREVSKDIGLECVVKNEVPPEEKPSEDSKTELQLHPIVYGGFKTMAVAYQSCEAARSPALTSEDQDLEGIAIVGKHETGRGNKREVSNLNLVQQTHAYLANHNSGGQCQSTFKTPLIYDFGGKPYSKSEADSPLDYFRNHGTGSKELGTDCSGYVFSALATAGLKLHPKVELKARGVLSYNARRFLDPIKGGTACFRKLQSHKSENIQNGDLVVTAGHIFIVDQANSHPLGVDTTASQRDCNDITEDDFNFEVLQSSPSKGALGINRMKATDYLKSSKTMRLELIRYAQHLCMSKFNSTQALDQPKLSVVRHKQTPECLSSKKIKLSKESCVKACL